MFLRHFSEYIFLWIDSTVFLFPSLPSFPLSFSVYNSVLQVGIYV